MTDLIPTPTPTALGAPSRERISRYLSESRSPATRRAYGAAWRDWLQYCIKTQAQPMPAAAESLADYLASLAEAGAKPSTLQVRISAIAAAHKTAGLDDPTKAEGVRRVLSGIRRAHGAGQRKAAPITRDRLRVFVGNYDARSLTGLRNRALLLTGFAGAFRESELAGILAEDITWQEDGSAMILVRKSKTDQEGHGIYKPLPRLEFSPYCPATALRNWLTAAGIEAGPVWRRVWRGDAKVGRNAIHPQTVYMIVKQAAERAGLDPKIFSGHSLRSGFCSQFGLDGGAIQDGMEVTGHRDTRTFMGYMRTGGRLARRASKLALTGE
jgi:site-specific recombinase XerD